MYNYIYIYIHMYHTCIRTCTYTCTDVYMYACIYMHAYMHTYIYTYIHAYMHTYIYTCIATEQSTSSKCYSTAIDYDSRPGLFGGIIGLFCANIRLVCAAGMLKIPVGLVWTVTLVPDSFLQECRALLQEYIYIYVQGNFV